MSLFSITITALAENSFYFFLSVFIARVAYISVLQHSVCRPSYSNESEDAGIELRTAVDRVVNPDLLNPDPVTDPDPAIHVNPNPDTETDPDPRF
jgi:hypothetical protein